MANMDPLEHTQSKPRPEWHQDEPNDEDKAVAALEKIADRLDKMLWLLFGWWAWYVIGLFSR